MTRHIEIVFHSHGEDVSADDGDQRVTVADIWPSRKGTRQPTFLFCSYSMYVTPSNDNDSYECTPFTSISYTQ
jgi:hypothetical protein